MSQMVLQRQDIWIADNIIFIHICRSKPDQVGKGVDIALRSCSVENICPVKAVLAYLALCGEQHGYLFAHRAGPPFKKYKFWKLTDKALQQADVSGLRFVTRSFRI